MRFRNIVILWAVLILLCLLPIFIKGRAPERDMVYCYNVVRQIEDGGEVPSSCQVIWLTDDDYESSLMRYQRSGALIMDIMQDGNLKGKVIWDDSALHQAGQDRAVFTKMISVWGLVAAAGTSLLAAVYIRYIRPFKKLQKFAGEVARGNLDFPLSAGRRDFFGNFTESFDIMREELLAARAKEAELKKAKQEMVAELSHDIRTPLAIINATCEVLEVRAKDPDVSEKTGIIKAKVETIDDLITNLMSASLDDLQELSVTPREESSLLIADMISDLSEFAKIRVTGSIPECLLYYDPLRLEQVIDNIVGNSIKYAGTDIEISYKKTDNGVVVSISDEGPGVPDDEISLLTQKFYRGKSIKEQPGSGLGLYLADHFMKRMEGDISFYNKSAEAGFVAEIFIRKVAN